MKKKTIRLLGKTLIILLWFLTFIICVYTLDKLQKSDKINDYFNKVKNLNLESPLHPPKWAETSDSIQESPQHTPNWEEVNIKKRYNRNNKNYTLLIPNYEQVFDGSVVRLKPTYVKINSDGFRDREFSLDKPSDTFRIIMLGDSSTFGWGVELNDSLPKQLESILNSGQSKTRYEVLNFGVSSQNTFGEVETFKDKGLKYNPDMVIVCFQQNDIEDELFKRELYMKFKEEYTSRGLDLSEYSMDINRKVLEAQEAKIRNTPFSETWKIVENPLEELVSIAQQRNMDILIYSLEIGEGIKENKALKDFADKHKRVYFTYADNPHLGRESLILHPLDPHPTPLAYSIHAKKIYETLIKQNLIPSDLK